MGEKNCISPDVPGQLLKKTVKRKATSDSEEEANKDLRSRGLYQVPGSCTLQVGSKMELILGTSFWRRVSVDEAFLPILIHVAAYRRTLSRRLDNISSR